MADQFGVSPDEVRKVAGGVGGVGSDFEELVSDLRGRSAMVGTPSLTATRAVFGSS